MNKKNLATNYLEYLIFLIPFFRIPIINNISVFSRLYTILELLAGILFAYKFFIKKSYKVSNIIYYVIVVLFLLNIITFLQQGNIRTALHYSYTCILYSLIVDYHIKNDFYNYFKVSSYFFYILIVVNLIFIIMYPNGMYTLNNLNEYTRYTQNWILGYKNDIILFIIGGIFFNFIYSIKTGKLQKKDYIFFIICFITSILSKSSTSVIGLTVFGILILAYFICSKFNTLKDLFNSNLYFYVLILIFFLIVIFNAHSLLSPLIEDIFHKNITLTGRTYIWKDVMSMILEKPLFGYGMEFYNYRLAKTVNYQVIHAHNQILEIIYRIGIIGFILFIFGIIKCKNRLYLYKESTVSIILSILLFSIGIMMISEYYSMILYLYILIACYNVDKIAYGINNKDLFLNKHLLNNGPLISIIIPIYNCDKYISICLKSIKNQTYKNFEVICINDGSTDNSEKIIKEFCKNDNRFRYKKIRNSGVSKARNVGMNLALGEYITFIDADDHVDDMYISVLYTSLSSKDVDCVISNARDYSEDGIIVKEKNNELNYLFNTNQAIKELLLEDKFVCTCWGNLYKSSICKSLKFDINMKICEDFKFLLNYINKSNNILVIDKVVYNYLIRKDSAVNSNFNVSRLDEINFCKKLINKYYKTNNYVYSIKRFVRINVDLICNYSLTKKYKVVFKNNIKKYLVRLLFSYTMSIKSKIKMLYSIILR